MLPSPGTDLFPCGTRVHMPSLHSPASVGNSRPNRSTPGGRTRVRSHTPKESRRSGISDRQMLARRTTVELGRSLQFSDDVVSSRSPQTISYAKSKGEMENIFRPDNLGFTLTTAPKESISRRDWSLTNKHYPCHLRGSSTRVQDQQRVEHRCRSRSLPGKPSDAAGSTEGWGVGQDHSFLSPRCSWRERSTVPRSSKTVPISASVLWEEQTLHRLSSATARRLVKECPRARERERLERLLERRPLDGAAQKSAPVSLSSSNAASLDAAEPILATPPRPDQASSSPPPVSFSDELRAGAKPVHRLGGDAGTIVLDSNVSFRKVLQQCYPQQPGEWSGGGGGAPPLLGRSCVRGQLRWTDFPQPVKVGERREPL